MKPKPLVALNHLTVPVDIYNFSKMRGCALCPHEPSRGHNPISAMFLGSGAGSARSTSKSTIRMGGVYAAIPEIASESTRNDKMLVKTAAADQPSRLICS